MPFLVTGNTITFYGVQLDTKDMLPLSSGGFMVDFDGGLEVLNTEITVNIGQTLSIQGGPLMRVVTTKGSNEDPVTTLYLQGVNK